MAVKLWTVHFMRICVANLLLFISLYVLFPVLSVEMADRLGVPAAQTGVIFLFFTLGMFLIGPFHAYLVDAYKRKYVCMFAAALMVVATIGYAFVTNLTELILLSTVQGLAFGIGTTAGITLAIDITNSTLRSAGNVSFSWMARMGMIAGIILGVWLYQSQSFQTLLTVSVITGAVGILMLSGVYVPFRAPIVHQTLFLRPLPIASWMGSCHQSDPDNLHSGTAGSHGTPFPKRFRTRKHRNPRTVLCRNSPRIHRFPVLCTSVFPERENTAAGHYRTRIGNRSHVPTEYRHLHRHFLRTLRTGLRLYPAGIPGDVRKVIPPLPTRNSQHHSFAGNRNRHFPGNRYRLLHGIGYR